MFRARAHFSIVATLGSCRNRPDEPRSDRGGDVVRGYDLPTGANRGCGQCTRTDSKPGMAFRSIGQVNGV
jgi:hypothetical protein